MAESSGDVQDFTMFENKTGLADDMKFLAYMPELCNVTFLVGESREPVCAVKAVLAARCRVLYTMLCQKPTKTKDARKSESKLKLFGRRSSEPLPNMKDEPFKPSQNETMIIEEFEPDVFRQLIEYIHTGYVTLQPRTLLGVMIASDYYGLEELHKECVDFVQSCINLDTVCHLLASADRYIQYKCTKAFVQQLLKFVDENGTKVLNLASFALLPQHVVRLVLAREELKADEFTKFMAALMWSKHYSDNNPEVHLREVFADFFEYIQFDKIPANVLIKDILPLRVCPCKTIMTALAYQADPTSVDPEELSRNPARLSSRVGRSMSVQISLGPNRNISGLNLLKSNISNETELRRHSSGEAESSTLARNTGTLPERVHRKSVTFGKDSIKFRSSISKEILI